jgi:hypothetical protein
LALVADGQQPVNHPREHHSLLANRLGKGSKASDVPGDEGRRAVLIEPSALAQCDVVMVRIDIDPAAGRHRQ